MSGASAVPRHWLARSFSTQLLGYAALLLLVMLTLAAVLSALAARPSAVQMARSLVVIAEVAEQALRLQPTPPTYLNDAGIFATLPPGSRQSQTWLPFANALRQELQDGLGRSVQLVRLADDETALWLPAEQPGQLAFGIRFEPARSPLTRSGIWVTLASAGVILLAAWWLARWLSRPLRQLSAALPALAAGAKLPELGRHSPLEIQSLAEALAEAMQRLRDQALAREQTLAGISHDLRTPLMRINLAAEMLPESPHRTRIQADVSSMDQLIAAALELARAGRAEPAEAVSLAALVERLVEPERQLWQLQIDPELRLRAPPLALRRALANLIENAQRHGQPPFAVRAQRNGPNLRLIVADSGSGLGELSVDSARQPFQQGRNSADGSGLGLAIVDRLAAAFDAQLSFEESEGECRAILQIPSGRIVS